MHHINDIYFCCICLNFFKIPLNVVSKERSRSNSGSNMKNSAKKGKLPYYLLLFYQSLLKWEELLCTKVNYNVLASFMSNENLTMLCFHGGIQDGI